MSVYKCIHLYTECKIIFIPLKWHVCLGIYRATLPNSPQQSGGLGQPAIRMEQFNGKIEEAFRMGRMEAHMVGGEFT